MTTISNYPRPRRRLSKGLIASGRDKSDDAKEELRSSLTKSNAVSSPQISADSSSEETLYAPLIGSIVESTLQMDILTKYGLCGEKGRKMLLLRGRARRRVGHSSSGGGDTNRVSSGSGNKEKYDEIIDQFLTDPPLMEGEVSSGDEDDYDDPITANNSSSRNTSANAAKEAYFLPTPLESSSLPITTSRLPFNYRKLPYFDDVTATDRAEAREFLRGEVRRLKRERIRRVLGKENVSVDNKGGKQQTLNQLEEDAAALMSRYPHELTPRRNAALLLESLSLNPTESMEGLGRCYDGIVSAGTAYLDALNNSSKNIHDIKTSLLQALEPLLLTLPPSTITTLVHLTTLKSFAQARHRRRFLQRLAPHLIRPPSAAIWCLRHLTDMESIVAGLELILEQSVWDGWRERGRVWREKGWTEDDTNGGIRVDVIGGGKRSLLGGLTTSGAHRRGSSFNSKSIGGIGNREMTEWESNQVEKLLKTSVSDLFSRDWSRIAALNLSPSESESYNSGRVRGFKKDWQPQQQHASSPRAKIPLSPRSSGVAGVVTQGQAPVVPSADALESTFGPSFSSQDIVENHGDHISPTAPLSPTRNNAPLSPTRNDTKLTHPKTPPSESHADHNQHPSSPGSYRNSGLAPLSPQSSVGNTSASSGALSSRSVSAPAGSKDQYRALTSTAAERKRTVAACRALRAQITKFEESFVQIHGRPPKSRSERAPLASTYMQYREWKRAVRADAACRIQALCRGALVRNGMERSSDPRVLRLVANRSKMRRGDRGHLSHLSIPLDIGSDHRESSADALNRGDSNRSSRLEARTSSRENDDGVEVVMRPNATSSPGWQRHKNLNQSIHNSPGSHGPNRTPSKSGLPDVTQMSLPELQQRKRELKQQLKTYDLNFHAQHGRMPEKREKEPIRHLYESYNAYKNQIAVIEKGEAQPGPGTAAFRGRDILVSTPPPVKETPDQLSPSGQSPVSKSPTNEGTPSPKNDISSTGRTSEASKSSDEAIPQDLASLKAEKATLHQLLRSYEKDFFKQHKRQVSSFGDIRPVAGQYRRYKEIKKAIAQLQER